MIQAEYCSLHKQACWVLVGRGGRHSQILGAFEPIGVKVLSGNETQCVVRRFKLLPVGFLLVC